MTLFERFSQKIFLLILNTLLLMRWPLYFVLRVLSYVIPAVKERFAFEAKNLSDYYSTPHQAKLPIKACFEVASQGELEQVLPLMLGYLDKQMAIEILFASVSVEQDIQSLATRYDGLVRYLRLPLIHYPFQIDLTKWVHAPIIYYCRYDFYPELVKLNFVKQAVLLSARLKNKSETSALYTWFYRQIYQTMDRIYPVTKNDESLFHMLDLRSKIKSPVDLRIGRIHKRKMKQGKTLSEKKWWSSLEGELLDYQMNRRLILGNAWPSDIAIFNCPTLLKKIQRKQLFVCIVPHKLSGKSYEEICRSLQELEIEYEVLDERHPQLQKRCNVVVVNSMGVLCELYHHFYHALVGRGFEGAIHSVLEPWVMGVQKIYLGPGVYRSSEYELVLEIEPYKIKKLSQTEDFSKEFLVEAHADKQNKTDENWNKYFEACEKTIHEELASQVGLS